MVDDLLFVVMRDGLTEVETFLLEQDEADVVRQYRQTFGNHMDKILSDKIDIANVRLAFPTGCIANLTASRVSTERIRKLRLFQPHQYISLDYSRQEAAAFAVKQGQQIDFHMLPVEKGEPLRAQLEHFLDCVVKRSEPRVSGADGLRALDCGLTILDKIKEHTQLVAEQLKSLP